MHLHPQLYVDPLWWNTRARPEDMSALVADMTSIGIDGLAAFGLFSIGPVAAVPIQGLQVALDAPAAISSGLWTWPQNKGFTSVDVSDAFGWIPWLGSLPDMCNVVSHATGIKRHYW